MSSIQGNLIADWFAEGKPEQEQISELAKLRDRSVNRLMFTNNHTSKKATESFLTNDESIVGVYERLVMRLALSSIKQEGRGVDFMATVIEADRRRRPKAIKTQSNLDLSQNRSYDELAAHIGAAQRDADWWRGFVVPRFNKFRKLALLIISGRPIKVRNIPRNIDPNVKRTKTRQQARQEEFDDWHVSRYGLGGRGSSLRKDLGITRSAGSDA